MNEEDVPRSPALGALISHARQASPPRARLDGVRARLEAQLGPLGSNVVDPQPSPPVAPPVEASASTAGPWIALTVVAIVAVVLGVITMGGDEEPAREPVSSPALEADTTPPETTTREVDPEVDTDIAPEVETEVLAPDLEVAPGVEPAREVVPSAHRPPEREGTEPPAELDTDPGSSLREEVVLLERAMRHRREGDLDAARSVLAEHAARFPNGHLAPERTRLLGELAAERATTHEDDPRPEITP